MSYVPHPTYAAKGSQRWLQVAVNRLPATIEIPLRESARLGANATFEWISPIERSGFVEYRDQPTFDALGLELAKRSLSDFWPARGACWDGLAKASTGDVFLLEAKAHIGEMVSGGSRATDASLERIRASLREVQQAIAPGADFVDWSGTFYQYANRLAHLHLLREQNGIPAHLVFVYFLNAEDVGGPAAREAYEGASQVIEHYLGVRQSKISRYVHKVFVDVKDLVAYAPTGEPAVAPRA
jgi:hypothetical protein